MVVEHFCHFPFVYAAKDYTAETVATVLFKHYCHHGTFEELASDPGSVFMSDVLKQLNSWLRIYHEVSLVGRHESNGTEGSNKQFLRHLREVFPNGKALRKFLCESCASHQDLRRKQDQEQVDNLLVQFGTPEVHRKDPTDENFVQAIREYLKVHPGKQEAA